MEEKKERENNLPSINKQATMGGRANESINRDFLSSLILELVLPYSNYYSEIIKKHSRQCLFSIGLFIYVHCF